MEYRKPAGILFSRNKNNKTHEGWLVVSPDDRYHDSVKALRDFIEQGDSDWIGVQYDHRNLPNDARSFKTMNLLTNEVSKIGNQTNKPVVNLEKKNSYLLNVGPSSYSSTMFNVHQGAHYAPSDAQVQRKFDEFNTRGDAVWEHHQSIMWKKMAATMPLGTGVYGVEDHKGELTSASRGLSEADVQDMWSWKSKVSLSPGLYDDDFIGMSGIKAVQFTDLEFYAGDKLVTSNPINLSTMGSDGYVIPMRNEHGDMAKFQIGTDVKAYNCELKAKTKDGVSIQKSEYTTKTNKNTKIYNFKMDGEPSGLRVTNANNKEVVFEDFKGEFVVPLKKDIKDVLKDRGYEIPEIIDSLKPVSGAKYMWPAKGDMVGSQEMSNKVAPSNAGFIVAREPKGTGKYDVLVVEGALKGKITAKYLGDERCADLADNIAGDNGIIVAQVPGVARAFVESVSRIYDKYPIEKTVIAMDADGRTNRNVADGIHQSVSQLAPYTKGNIAVMSWDPEQKGIDDALLAMSRGEIDVSHMDLKFGSAKELFPLHEAKRPIPVKLDGTPAYTDKERPEWQVEYTAQRIERERQLQVRQIATELRNGERDLESFLNDIVKNVDIDVVSQAGKLSDKTDDMVISDDDLKGVFDNNGLGRG